jgi:hypothetical protein
MPKTAIHTKHTQEMSSEHLSILCELFLKSYFSPKFFTLMKFYMATFTK